MIEKGYRPANYEEQIKFNWNHWVMLEDTIIHLGDVITHRHSELSGILDYLPGRKWLVKGNHDDKSDNWYLNNGFDFVANGILTKGCWLTHAPQMTLPEGAVLNIHGHMHDNNHRGEISALPKHCKLLALEFTGYKPVELVSFAGLSVD